MIVGMTGFGAADFSVAKLKGTVEIKTVNHRYLDPAYYLPAGFSAQEERIAKLIAKNLKRGRVTISVRVTEKPPLKIVVNEEAVRKYLEFGKNLSRRYTIDNNLKTADLMSLPGVVEAKENFIDAQTMWPAVSKALDKAIASVVAMRRREGLSLKADITVQLNGMSQAINQIKSRVKEMVKSKKSELSPEEMVSYQKSNDINEELSRLAHHIDEAKALLKVRQEAGKKIDFIAQEMQRETNTIGSKVQDKEVSAIVISLKSRVEKIREQGNNVE